MNAPALDLCRFVDASPTPYHAAQEVARRLDAAGFSALDERQAWQLAPGDKRYVIRGGSTIIGFVVGGESPAVAGLRMIGSHTDSPTFRVKPNADVHKNGYRQVGVEVYGAPLYSTWLDRDLSIAGRALFSRGAKVEAKLVRLPRPVARMANLAIHLNRGVNKDGLVLNEQKHLPPLLGIGDKADLKRIIAGELGEDAKDLVAFDLMVFDTAPSALGGLENELVFAPRLDNLGSCHAATTALANGAGAATAHTRLIALYDHEECGSLSAVGAQGTVLRDTLRRIVEARSASEPQAFERAMAGSLLISADMAHAVHPNYADQHEPDHQPLLGKGVVIKSNSNQRYATNGETAARFTAACREAGFSPQHFVTRSDVPCGSTIGPITAGELGVQTVDVGAPVLSMHSCREMAGAADVGLAIGAYGAALQMAY